MPNQVLSTFSIILSFAMIFIISMILMNLFFDLPIESQNKLAKQYYSFKATKPSI
jgi:hypothetical protein